MIWTRTSCPRHGGARSVVFDFLIFVEKRGQDRIDWAGRDRVHSTTRVRLIDITLGNAERTFAYPDSLEAESTNRIRSKLSRSAETTRDRECVCEREAHTGAAQSDRSTKSDIQALAAYPHRQPGPTVAWPKGRRTALIGAGECDSEGTRSCRSRNGVDHRA